MKLRLLLCVIQLALLLLCTVVVMGWIMSLVLLRHETDRFIFRVASETPGIVEVFVQEHGLSLADESPVMALRLHLNAELQTEANQSWAMLSLMALIGVTIAQGVLIVRGDRARGTYERGRVSDGPPVR